MKRLAPLLLAPLLFACTPAPQPITGSIIALPARGGGNEDGCESAGIGIAAVLRGSPSDPRVVWLENFLDGGGRQEVVWPQGFSARFAPRLEVLDSGGRIVMREGDYVDSACARLEPGLLYLSPPFLALRLECGPMSRVQCESAVSTVARANGWPYRGIAEIEFVTADGQYRLTFDDGALTAGPTPSPPQDLERHGR